MSLALYLGDRPHLMGVFTPTWDTNNKIPKPFFVFLEKGTINDLFRPSLTRFLAKGLDYLGESNLSGSNVNNVLSFEKTYIGENPANRSKVFYRSESIIPTTGHQSAEEIWYLETDPRVKGTFSLGLYHQSDVLDAFVLDMTNRNIRR